MEFEMQPYGVYVKTDEADRIIAINSSAFLRETDGWTLIDEGHGDRYHHAQGNYLKMPIIDERGVYRYELVDGKPEERTAEEMDADYTPPEPKASIESRMDTVEGETAELRDALDLLLSGVTE